MVSVVISWEHKQFNSCFHFIPRKSVNCVVTGIITIKYHYLLLFRAMFGFLFLPLAIFWYQVVRVKKKKEMEDDKNQFGTFWLMYAGDCFARTVMSFNCFNCLFGQNYFKDKDCSVTKFLKICHFSWGNVWKVGRSMRNLACSPRKIFQFRVSEMPSPAFSEGHFSK